jgi:hypothetical protein
MSRHLQILALLLLLLGAPAAAEDANILRPIADLDARLRTMPFEILKADKARGLAEDTALKSDVRFSDGVELRIKIRPANYRGSEFNNEPRYDLAAYLLQAAFLDEADYVVPPTALRMLPRSQLAPFANAPATFGGANEVLVVVQYWLQKVSGPKEVLDLARFTSDPNYARHVGNLNVLTFLIAHGDSNAGNIMLSTDADSPRVFDVDNGIAFRSPTSDRGVAWKSIRVPRVPARTIERLRGLDAAKLEALLGAVATFELSDGHFTAVANEPRLAPTMGVRHGNNRVQLGLTKNEIGDVDKRRKQLLERVDKGELGTF